MANQQPITFIFNFNSTALPPLNSDEQHSLHPQYYYPPQYYPSPYYYHPSQYIASNYTHQSQYYPAQPEFYYPPQPAAHQHIPESHRSASVAASHGSTQDPAQPAHQHLSDSEKSASSVASSHGSSQGLRKTPCEKCAEHQDAASDSLESFFGEKEEESNILKGAVNQDDKLV